MIFNTTDNRTKFDRLKRSTANVSIPFNAGRRTGFKATAAASDIRMEDWISAKIASGAIEPLYKSYVARVTLSATPEDVVAVVMHNDLGGTVAWQRSAEGRYTATLINAFTTNKTAIFTSPSNVAAVSAGTLTVQPTDEDQIRFIFYSDAGAEADVEASYFIEIKVYS